MQLKLTFALRYLSALCLACVSLVASAVTVNVVGTSNPWLAGMPVGTTSPGGDSAPGQSPVLVTGLNLSWGGYLTFTGATGAVSNDPHCSVATCGVSPDGRNDWSSHSSEHGISGVWSQYNALLGVFLDDSQPDSTPAPGYLGTGNRTADMNFVSVSPLLKQVFFIGDGMNSSSVVQTFNVPDGATRLFLGTFDGSQWINNIGAIQVDVTQFATPPTDMPVPGTVTLLIAALLATAFTTRKKLRARE